jgi:hypothetical protein
MQECSSILRHACSQDSRALEYSSIEKASNACSKESS